MKLALQNHEPYIYPHAQRLENLIATLSAKPFNVTQVFEYYTFDVMGEINFGVHFDMLEKKKPDPAVEVFKKGTTLMGPFTPVPWLFHVTVSIPGLQGDWLAFRQWADQTLRTRLAVSFLIKPVAVSSNSYHADLP